MTSNLPGFFQGTEMPTAGWWEALWPNPAGVLTAVGIKPGMEVIDLCSSDGWFTVQIAKSYRNRYRSCVARRGTHAPPGSGRQ
jgi:hypothetical protein